jgi:hypothetical protein
MFEDYCMLVILFGIFWILIEVDCGPKNKKLKRQIK